MLKVNLFSAKGTKLETFALPKDFEEKGSLKTVAQAIRYFEALIHPGLQKTKTRGEVNRTTKKIYKQKGTGGARHGSRSAPIYVGGGVAGGPRPIERKLVLSKKMADKALKIVLSLKAKKGSLVLVKGIDSLLKTKEAQSLINKMKETLEIKKKEPMLTFVLKTSEVKTVRVLRNIENVSVEPFANMNAYKAYRGGLLIFDQSIFEVEKEVKEKKEVKKVAKKVKKETK
jgi:large subunit ribosomal protein L4